MSGNTILAVGSEQQAEYEESLNADTNNNGTNGNLSTAPEVDGNPDPASVEEEVQGDSVDTPETETGEQEPEATEDGFYFGDLQVEVEVPAEISAALKEAKIDESSLLKELFAKEGKFELAEKTKAALDKKFGKSMVDGYLNLFRQQNTMTVQQYKADMEAQGKMLEANSADFDTLVGGTDGWNELAEWASDNLSDTELEQVNSVMSLPVEHYAAQRMVIEALQIKRQTAQGKADGDSAVVLPTDGAAPAGGSQKDSIPSRLTREEFQTLMNTERYRKDPAYANAVDNVRRATQKLEKPVRR